jgi:hypothetical protein
LCTTQSTKYVLCTQYFWNVRDHNYYNYIATIILLIKPLTFVRFKGNAMLPVNICLLLSHMFFFRLTAPPYMFLNVCSQFFAYFELHCIMIHRKSLFPSYNINRSYFTLCKCDDRLNTLNRYLNLYVICMYQKHFHLNNDIFNTIILVYCN